MTSTFLRSKTDFERNSSLISKEILEPRHILDIIYKKLYSSLTIKQYCKELQENLVSEYYWLLF